MRHLFRIIWITGTGTLALLVATFTLAPPTAAEKAVRPTESRLELVQLRLARSLLHIAPTQTAQFLSARSGLPEEDVLANLKAFADGHGPGEATSNRQTKAGSALFVTPD